MPRSLSAFTIGSPQEPAPIAHTLDETGVSGKAGGVAVIHGETP